MIHIEKLSVSYGEQKVIEGLNITFSEKTFYGITGVSGVGKTTILGAIAGLIKYEGKINNFGKKIGYIFQEPRLFPWMTALENVTCVCDDKEKAKYFLDLLLPDSHDKYPDELSGGMKQRVSIARALAYDCDILLLDEPFKGLDEQTKNTTVNTVLKHLKGKTAIMVSHSNEELSLCNTVYRIDSSPVTSLTEVKSGICQTE